MASVPSQCVRRHRFIQTSKGDVPWLGSISRQLVPSSLCWLKFFHRSKYIKHTKWYRYCYCGYCKTKLPNKRCSGSGAGSFLSTNRFLGPATMKCAVAYVTNVSTVYVRTITHINTHTPKCTRNLWSVYIFVNHLFTVYPKDSAPTISRHPDLTDHWTRVCLIGGVVPYLFKLLKKVGAFWWFLGHV